jgi:hypothetical protein
MDKSLFDRRKGGENFTSVYGGNVMNRYGYLLRF